jgi:hypothetical protein
MLRHATQPHVLARYLQTLEKHHHLLTFASSIRLPRHATNSHTHPPRPGPAQRGG